jgi:hypothetical protein
MRKTLVVISLLAVFFLGLAFFGGMTRHGEYRGCTSSLPRPLIDIGSAGSTELTVLFDNNSYDPELKTAWGFSCYIKVRDMKILFDTGGDPKILFDNMDKLGVTVDEVGIIVLSHIHGDHVGGLFEILNKNCRIKVYVPASFPESFKSRIRSYGCEMVEVEESLNICEGVMTTGELGTGIKEQSLIINSPKGLIVVTGCAHPGIMNIVEKSVRTDRSASLSRHRRFPSWRLIQGGNKIDYRTV